MFLKDRLEDSFRIVTREKNRFSCPSQDLFRSAGFGLGKIKEIEDKGSREKIWGSEGQGLLLLLL